MKIKSTNFALLVIGLFFAMQVVKAQQPQQLIHFWDFNATLPVGGGGGDSLGTATFPLPPSYSKLSSANPKITFSRPHAIQTHCAHHDSILDNGAGPPEAYYFDYSGSQYNYLNTNDSGGTALGNLFIRSRNPDANSVLYIYLPTTNYKNINFGMAISASSKKGARYNVFQYSTTGIAGPWLSNFNPTALDTFTNARWATWKHDTLLVTDPTAPASGQGVNNSLWEPIGINFSAIAAINNNPNFIIRIIETAPTLSGTDSNAVGTSGNDRYDNFALLGDSNTTSPVAYIVNRTNVGPCFGDSNGSARVYVKGGVSPFVYSWSSNVTNSHAVGGQTTDSCYGLKAGTYTVTVTDINDSAVTAVVTILQPSQVTPTVATKTNISCNGGATGVITLNPSGGTSPYTYAWSNTKTTSSITGLTIGTYSCLVTDHFGCSNTVSVTLTQPTALTVGSSTTPVTCVALGSATALPSGGTPHIIAPAYTYQWVAGPTTQTYSSLATGTYTVTVTDSLGCSTSTSATVVATGSPIVNLTPTSPLCNGSSNGSVSSSVSGGTTPYTYSWSNSATSPNINAITAGSYTLTVTDHLGCNGSGSIVVTQPAVLKDTIVGVGSGLKLIHFWDFNQTLPIGGAGGDSLGTATYPLPADFSAIPSTNPHLVYTHPITSGITDNVAGPPYAYINDLSIGNDTASLAANNVGIRTRNPTLNSSFLWYIPTTGYQNITLDWALSSSSATKPAQYFIFSYSTNGGATWNKLTAAMDTFNIGGHFYPDTLLALNPITGASNWYAVHIDLTTAPGINNNPNVVFKINYGGSHVTNTSGNNRFDNISVRGVEIPKVSCNGGNNGAAASDVTGGTGPYTYAWSNTATTDTITGLSAGTFTVTVSDHHGCSTTASVNIINPPVLSNTFSVNNGCNNSNNGTAKSIPSGGTGPYLWSWSTSSTSNIVSGLSPASYSVTITDANGCQLTASTTITNPPVLTSNINPTFITCNGANNGMATASAGGGTSPYSYQWSLGAGHSTNAAVTGLTPGLDTVTVTDADGCTSTASINMTQPATLRDSVISGFTNISCFGGNNGSATVGVIGGTTPYTYAWSPSGGNAATANNLIAGSYTVNVTDVNGCNLSASVTLTQPATAVSVSSISPVTYPQCNGGVGTAMANANGGVGSYQYSWNTIPAQTNAQATGLTAAMYTVTVTDGNGCSATASINISQPTVLTVSSISATPTTCSSSVGTATASGSGGTPGYTYTWSNSATGANITGLSAGTYSVTVNDLNSCSVTSSVMVTTTNGPRDSIATFTNITCTNLNNGKATVGVKNGATPYTYSWNTLPVQTSAMATGLSAGSYTVTVTDANGCSSFSVAHITNPAQLRDSIISIVDVPCYGTNGGHLTVGVIGGTTPYTYAWSPSGGTNQSAANISAGTYTVTVTDANGCPANIAASATITQPASLVIDSAASVFNGCIGENNGTAKVGVRGGTPGYVYSWSTSPIQTNATATGLSAGTYSVTVNDANGCVNATLSITIAPASIPNVTFTLGADSVICDTSHTLSLVSMATPTGGVFSGTGITGNIFNAHTAGNGTHTLKYKFTSVAGCSDSATQNIRVKSCAGLGIASLNDPVGKIVIYPNPNNGHFTISGLAVGSTLELYNTLGQLLGTSKAMQETMQLDISGQPNGIYLVRVISKDGNSSTQQKIIKAQ